CVRNPLAVAESLWVRDAISYTDAFDLWLTYNRRVLATAPIENRLITHCDSYLHDPHAELRRVLQWAGLTATKEQASRACQRIEPCLVHHRMTMDDLADAGASDDLVRCYLELRDEAGFPEKQRRHHLLDAPKRRVDTGRCSLPFILVRRNPS